MLQQSLVLTHVSFFSCLGLAFPMVSSVARSLLSKQVNTNLKIILRIVRKVRLPYCLVMLPQCTSPFRFPCLHWEVSIPPSVASRQLFLSLLPHYSPFYTTPLFHIGKLLFNSWFGKRPNFPPFLNPSLIVSSDFNHRPGLVFLARSGIIASASILYILVSCLH